VRKDSNTVARIFASEIVHYLKKVVKAAGKSGKLRKKMPKLMLFGNYTAAAGDGSGIFRMKNALVSVLKHRFSMKFAENQLFLL